MMMVVAKATEPRKWLMRYVKAYFSIVRLLVHYIRLNNSQYQLPLSHSEECRFAARLNFHARSS
jgi:hypothetical protein